MSEWLIHSEDDIIPEWLKTNLPSNCPYCKSPMINYYNDDYRCTNRKCSNEHCISFAGYKGNFMFKLLDYKGIGPETCIGYARELGSNHVAMLGLVRYTPTLKLGTYLRIHCFEGVDSEWDKVCEMNDWYTLDDLFENYDGKFRYIIDVNRELLYDNLQYVNLVERPIRIEEVKEVLTIMITGTPIGFDSKDDFIDQCNEACCGLIKILHQKTKRQSDVDFLIREPGSTTRGKVEAAKRGGIPIVTSQQFLMYLYQLMAALLGENVDTETS